MDSKRQALVEKVLGDSSLYPQELKGYLSRSLIDNPLFFVQRTQVAGIEGGQWHLVATAPPFLNGWVNFGGAYAPAAFYTDFISIIRFRGRIKTGTIGSPAFNLPAGFRPEMTMRYAVDSNGAHGVVEVAANGDVTPVVGNNASVSLDGIWFRQFA